MTNAEMRRLNIGDVIDITHQEHDRYSERATVVGKGNNNYGLFLEFKDGYRPFIQWEKSQWIKTADWGE